MGPRRHTAISASTPAPTSAPPYYRASSNPAGSRHCLAPLLPRHRPQPPVVIQSSTVSNQIMSVRPTSASHITTNKLDHGTCTHSHFHTHAKHPHASPRISIHDDNMPSNNPRSTTTTTYTTSTECNPLWVFGPLLAINGWFLFQHSGPAGPASNPQHTGLSGPAFKSHSIQPNKPGASAYGPQPRPFCGQRKEPNSWPAFSSCGLASSSCNQQ